MSTKPTELCISVPEAFDGSYDKSMQGYMPCSSIYLLVNKAVYDTNEKQIAFALFYMTKGSALTWASTFRQSTISGTLFTLGTFADFVMKFNTAFKHHNVTGNAISWLSTKWMQKNVKNSSYSPSLIEYISTFKNHVTLANISDPNVLIGYFSAGIPPPLMRRIMSMDTVPSTIDNLYKKAIAFQTQWERANDIARRNSKTSHQTYHSFSNASTTKNHDPNAMVVDTIKVSKLTPEERKRCIEKKLCFHCWKPGHSSTTCTTFSQKGNPKVQKVASEELPKLEEIDDEEEEEVVRKISFKPLDF